MGVGFGGEAGADCGEVWAGEGGFGGGGDLRFLEIFAGEIEAATGGVFGEVAQDICQLQGAA